MMYRLDDWEARLAAYLEPLREMPHAYGKHDCAHFCGGAVKAMTGVDPMPEMRGRYTTARGSVRALRKFGAGTLAATLAAKFGEPLPPALAHRGDIVMDDRAIGISMGAFAIMVGQQDDRPGLVRVPMREWTQVWSVPFEAVA